MCFHETFLSGKCVTLHKATAHTHTHTHVYIYIYTYIYTLTHTYIYIYIYTHTHTHTLAMYNTHLYLLKYKLLVGVHVIHRYNKKVLIPRVSLALVDAFDVVAI